jgi:hypothetical protein
MRITVLALALGISVVSVTAMSAGNGKGHGASPPGPSGHAANAPGHSARPAGVPGVAANVIPGAAPSGGPVLIVPASPSANATLPAASAIRLSPPGGSGPASTATRAGAMPEAKSVKPSAMNDQPRLRSEAPGNHRVSHSAFDTVKGEHMLPAGRRVELVDPSTPELRVEVTAPPDRALDIKAMLSESRNSGIFAGLFGRHKAASAQRATVLDDGRIVLVARRPPNTGKGVEHAHQGHAELSHDKDHHIRGTHNKGSRQLHHDNSRDGKALAREHDSGDSSGQHKSNPAVEDAMVSMSATARKVSSEESAEDKGLTTIIRSVDGKQPRICS